MNQAQVGENIEKLMGGFDQSSFIYDLLRAYGLPKSTITRLQNGDVNLSLLPDDVLLKKKLFFRHEPDADLHTTMDTMKVDPASARYDVRFVVVTDFKTLLGVDTKTGDTLDIPITDLTKHYHFFLPWAGMEKAKIANENKADVKAAEKMAKLFDIIRRDNPSQEAEDIHALNVFLTRLLFCFFGEDTKIFADNIFTSSIASHTNEDGSDLKEYLETIFTALNTPKPMRSDLPVYFDDFHYVNGGLFAKHYPVPIFGRKSRKMILECGELQWAEINPDIFGSMFQAVIDPEERGDKGMHYTSVPNIMKVIEPLFLNKLKEEFEKSFDNKKKLQALLDRIYNLKIFDPACGSGNFLIIAYKEIRTLEIEIFQRLNEGEEAPEMMLSRLSLSQFYGIEIDDFAHEIAILSLWLAEHQMNVKFKQVFGHCNPSLPLKEGGNIACDNATSVDWEDVCPKVNGDETYILGNPPFVGFQNQSDDQKEEIKYVFRKFKNFKRIDYIGCWFKKASDYISNSKRQFAFVSTNSICQGEQTCIIWPYVFGLGLEIGFAYTSFNWTNNAKNKAKVTCVIIGLSSSGTAKDKIIYKDGMNRLVASISPYLVVGNETVILPRNKSLSQLPKMSIGNVPLDGNNFILSEEEKDSFLAQYPEDHKFIRRYMGAADFMRDNKRYCIWVTDETKEEAENNLFIRDRIEKCREFRMNGGIVARQHVHVSHRFRTQPHKETNSIIFPKTTSSRREYIPAGFLTQHTIISEKALVAYDAKVYLFGLLSSKMHMVWLSVTSSRMRNDFQYSVQLSYNTFPWPKVSRINSEMISNSLHKVLEQRELFSEKTPAQLYDPDKMPEGLREAHHELDLAVERCYRTKPFTSDEERLEHLFKLYEEMIEAEKCGELL